MPTGELTYSGEASVNAIGVIGATGVYRRGLLTTLMSLSKTVRALMLTMLSELDLEPGQDQILNFLHSKDCRTVSEVAVSLNVRPSTISKSVKLLKKRGYVTLERSTTDARTTLLRLTPDGLALQEKVRALYTKLDEELRSTMCIEDPSIGELLAVIDAVLKKRLARLR